MDSLNTILDSNKGGKLLAIFPHPDDESFVAGGLFQAVKKYKLNTSLICLTKGEKGLNSFDKGNLKYIRASEFKNALSILGIDNYNLKNYADSKLKEQKTNWVPYVQKILTKEEPDIVVTFDHSGITGHPDHIVTCHEILQIVSKLKNKPILLWRVPDEKEINYFKRNKAMKFSSKANYNLNYGLGESINKIKAIYAHKSQMKNFSYKLQILEWFLFDHQEQYFKVDLKKKYNYRFVPYKVK